MIKVLIPTRPDDAHALYVKLALENLGHQADLWFTADFPSLQTHCFELEAGKLRWRLRDRDLELSQFRHDLVWYRRPSKPILPEYLHSEDRENAIKENWQWFQNLWQVILPNAIWINPVFAATRAQCKLLQLKLAADLGMQVPNTLVSNQADAIKRYIQQHETGVIYKTLYPMVWLKQKEVHLTYTSPISLLDLPSDPVLQATPGIFQKAIPKAYELRVTYFGDTAVAVKIHSQEHEAGKMDWRRIPIRELKMEWIVLPEKLDRQCRILMRQLGIVFACFDFIVTPGGDYFFLELNEQGQFLWIEEVNPEIPMLKTFLEFLLSYDMYAESKELPELALGDYTEAVSALQAVSMKEHLKVA